MDRLKPALSEFPVTAYEPPRRGRPPVAQRPQSPMPRTPSLQTPLSKARSLKKRVRFLLQSSARRNPRRIVRDKHLGSLQSLKMLGGPLWMSKIVVFHKSNQIYMI